MSVHLPEMEDLARRLLAFGADHGPRSDGQVDAAVHVCETLRLPISKLTGVYGFASLMSRALALAKREVPSLQVVRIRPDGSLDGWGEVGRDGRVEATGGAVLVARLLGLLVTFIGEPLTLRLVRDAWPELPEDGTGRSKGVES